MDDKTRAAFLENIEKHSTQLTHTVLNASVDFREAATMQAAAQLNSATGLFLIAQLDDSTERMQHALKAHADATDDSARWMFWLTVALAVFAAMQGIGTIW